MEQHFLMTLFEFVFAFYGILFCVILFFAPFFAASLAWKDWQKTQQRRKQLT